MRRTLFFFLVWSLMASGPLAAQSAEHETRVWASLGLGGGVAQDLDVDGALTLQATAQWRRHHVALRAFGMGDIGSFPDGSDDAVGEVSIVYGRRIAWSFGYAAAAAGLAAVSGEGFSGTPSETRRTIGLPVVVEGGLQSPVIGFGIQGWANLNSLSSYAGVSIFLQVGWMS